MSDRNRIKKICGALTALLALLAVVLVFGACGEMPDLGAAEPSPTPAPTASPIAKPTPTPSPTPSPTPTPTPTPEPTDELPPETPTETEEPYTGPDLPEREPVGDEFFADTLFVGNSLVHGLWMYGGINSADYAAGTSASVVNLDRVRNEALRDVSPEYAPSVLESISAGSYDKVYLLLGINEIGFETPDFIYVYSALLDTIVTEQPEADIYIMGLSPLTREKDAEGYPFTMERVLSYNEALRELAAQREMYYVDLVEALGDESGFMPEEDSTDGVHLVRERYPKWAEYLRSHYACEDEEYVFKQ